jgi:hypothetical protein
MNARAIRKPGSILPEHLPRHKVQSRRWQIGRTCAQPEIHDILERHRSGSLAEIRADNYAMAIDVLRPLAREGAER